MEMTSAPNPLSSDVTELKRCVQLALPAVKVSANKSIRDSVLRTLSPGELDATLDDAGLTCRERVILRKLQHGVNGKLYPCGKIIFFIS